MDFGLFMMPLHPPRRSFADSYDRDTTLLVQADQLGYHEAWIGEHITETWENAPVPELLIANALALTERSSSPPGSRCCPSTIPWILPTASRCWTIWLGGASTGGSASGRWRPICTCTGSNITRWTKCGSGGRRPWR